MVDCHSAEAEVVRLKCQKCGHEFVQVADDPCDRETDMQCPVCGEYTPEYGRWVRERVALIEEGVVYYSNGTAIDLATVLEV